jgi:xanthine dehydrogenase accessory factor
MTCQSEGTLAIYLEPWLPKPGLVVIGQSPMARSLVALGDRLGFKVSACDPSATGELFPDAESLVQELGALGGQIGPRSYVIVATMGHYDEEALEAALSGQVSYVGLVASPRRGRAVIDYLRAKGVSEEALGSVRYPAGLDIGAETPEEIALSILTEIVQRMRAEPQGVSLNQETHAAQIGSTAIDPICNMTVKVADSRYHSNYNGTTFHFCCLACKDQFEQAPEKHSLTVA